MNPLRIFFYLIVIIFTTSTCTAQHEKISHAEPLFLDFVRDLGARKGEKELNIGAEFSKHKNYIQQAYLVEYEFAPINRWGFEAELDFSFFKNTIPNALIPKDKLECLRLSSQYSFFVSPAIQTTTAVGYTQIVEFTDFEQYGNDRLITGTIFNPFFIVAKRWEADIHTLAHALVLVKHDWTTRTFSMDWQLNTSLLFRIPHSKHLSGFELFHATNNGKYEVTFRPQVKLKFYSNLATGLLFGLPIHGNHAAFSGFFRLIYEP